MNTAAFRDERGSIMLLAIAFIGITLFAIAIVTDASTLFRQHRALVALADGAALAAGFWPFVYGFSLIGLPVGFALLIALLVLSQARRRAEFKRNTPKNRP